MVFLLGLLLEFEALVILMAVEVLNFVFYFVIMVENAEKYTVHHIIYHAI